LDDFDKLRAALTNITFPVKTIDNLLINQLYCHVHLAFIEDGVLLLFNFCPSLPCHVISPLTASEPATMRSEEEVLMAEEEELVRLEVPHTKAKSLKTNIKSVVDGLVF
jgi:hypothetical protein